MENKVIYKQSSLAPRTLDSVSGSEYWSIEGRKVQFTWFTVPNNTKFPKHKHESEQVTYVLEGELFFKSENSVYKLSKGDLKNSESITIMSEATHRRLEMIKQ